MRIKEDIHETLFDALAIHLLRCRNDDAADEGMNLAALEHRGGLTHIFDTAVSA